MCRPASFAQKDNQWDVQQNFLSISRSGLIKSRGILTDCCNILAYFQIDCCLLYLLRAPIRRSQHGYSPYFFREKIKGLKVTVLPLARPIPFPVWHLKAAVASAPVPASSLLELPRNAP